MFCVFICLDLFGYDGLGFVRREDDEVKFNTEMYQALNEYGNIKI